MSKESTTEKNNQWVVESGNKYYMGGKELPAIEDKLPPGVYQVEEMQTPMGLKWNLVKLDDSFPINYKTYGMFQNHIKRIVHVYRNKKENLGALMTGLQGTGKTIAAKMICNELKLPVILANKPIMSLTTILRETQQEVIIFLDEIEKNYDLYTDSDSSEELDGQKNKMSVVHLLSLMDGIDINKFKRLFLLTSNKEYLPQAMKSRPSRIRYFWEFGNLEVESIKLILDDILISPEKHVENIVEFLQTKSLITVDIVKTVAEEVNLFDNSNNDFLKLMNIEENQKCEYTITNSKGQQIATLYNTPGYLGYNFNTVDPENDEKYIVARMISSPDLEKGTVKLLIGTNLPEKQQKREECKIAESRNKLFSYPSVVF